VKAKRKRRPRGRCSVCGFSFPLCRDGSVRSHSLFCGSEAMEPCKGSRLPAAPESEVTT
jgi:hypothetical protein